MEQNDEWTAGHRYFSQESMAYVKDCLTAPVNALTGPASETN